GNVFNDANGNKTKDAGETGLSGWRVFNDSNNDGIWQKTEASTTTDSTGAWSFTTLGAGTFVIRVVRPGGWTQTTTSPAVFSLASGASRTGLTFGERQTG